jgi:hypothetical protein
VNFLAPSNLEGDLNPEGCFDEGFAVVCKNPDCTLQLITKDTLAIRKLAEDLVRDDGTYHSCLA